MTILEERGLEFSCYFNISGWILEIIQVRVISLTCLQIGTLIWEYCCIFPISFLLLQR